MDIVVEKKKIIEWIDGLNDPTIIERIKEIANPKKFNFDIEFKNAISSKEFKKRTTDFLKNLEWEKP